MGNRPGLTPIAFNVRDIEKRHAHPLRTGLEIVSPPEGHEHHVRAVLKSLRPLGGVIFRHPVHRKYRRPSAPT
jgi:hypothetical protein